ncbi:hypothetical protein ROHU_000972 [Labeo rohita]|uniref:Uncharacterized protein n=1 Tax=Labeo rohita TaxID=84645 RepID=A0A498P315_LABRO|nr:hypothetical protein ROHU_000972 [Labeo rohita]
MQVMHDRGCGTENPVFCCHLVAAPPDIETYGRKNRFRTRFRVSHLLSRQMIHSEEATECAEACTATIFSSTGVNRASRTADLVDSGAAASGLAPLPASVVNWITVAWTRRHHVHARRTFTSVTAHTLTRRTSHVLNSEVLSGVFGDG